MLCTPVLHFLLSTTDGGASLYGIRQEGKWLTISTFLLYSIAVRIPNSNPGSPNKAAGMPTTYFQSVVRWGGFDLRNATLINPRCYVKEFLVIFIRI
jgi:hypothetical protein